MKIFTVKPGVESIAIAECNSVSISAQILSKGIICAQSEREQLTTDHCFASWQFAMVEEILCDGPGLMTKITEWFCASIRSETINSPWSLIWLVPSENGFLPDHSKSVRIIELLKKKISRISKLAQTGYPESMIPLRGLFIIEGDNNRFFLSRAGFYYGQRRMKDDPQAPSRSFLKIEEAFSVFGQSPSAGDSVVDLGAAPGGWSYSAAKRGATVFAIDNGPLKKGASDNPAIKHMKQDAFFWRPEKPVDWLFCDMVEEPSRVIKLINIWLHNRLCRYAVVNLKYGYADPFTVLTQVRGPDGCIPLATQCICRHLYHDRDEFTIMIKV